MQISNLYFNQKCLHVSFLIYLSISIVILFIDFIHLLAVFSNSCQMTYVLCLLLAEFNNKVRFSLFHIKIKFKVVFE